MGIISGFLKKLKFGQKMATDGELYEFCTRCNATLKLQKGFDASLPYWVCKGCGEMLINPELDFNIIWRCDECGALLNTQDGFSEECGEWTCAECGNINKIDESQVYSSEDELIADMKNPYKGLSDEDALALSYYCEEQYIDGRENVILVTHRETGKRYIKKLLSMYDKSVYEYIKDNPIEFMPKIVSFHEGKNRLIVIEEYIEGKTLDKILSHGPVSADEAVYITKRICEVLDKLHNLPRPIIHRDIKPSNIIITPNNEVYLLDINVAKWFDPTKKDDTHYMGTQFFAAPEQVGYGFSSSSAKTDIYAVGMLLNVMLTGKFPKGEKATGVLWDIIERCISLDAEKRYTARELIESLEKLKG